MADLHDIHIFWPFISWFHLPSLLLVSDTFVLSLASFAYLNIVNRSSMRYSRMLEESSFPNRKADYFWLLTLSGIFLLVSSVCSWNQHSIFFYTRMKKKWKRDDSDRPFISFFYSFRHYHLSSIFHSYLPHSPSCPSTFGHEDIPRHKYLFSDSWRSLHPIFPSLSYASGKKDLVPKKKKKTITELHRFSSWFINGTWRAAAGDLVGCLVGHISWFIRDVWVRELPGGNLGWGSNAPAPM